MGFLHNPDNRQGDGLKERTKGTELFRDFLRKLFCPRLHTSTPSPHLQSTRQHIQRTLQPPEAPGYSHPVFQHKSSKTLTQGMTTGLFVNAGKRHGSFHRLLQPGFKGMITQLSAGTRIDEALLGRKNPLPNNLTSSVGNLLARTSGIYTSPNPSSRSF